VTETVSKKTTVVKSSADKKPAAKKPATKKPAPKQPKKPSKADVQKALDLLKAIPLKQVQEHDGKWVTIEYLVRITP
jgi:hypothetical protein